MNANTAIKAPNKAKAHHYPVKLMGCGFVLTAVDADPQKAWDAIRAAEKEIIRIENLISSWKPNSQTTAINNQSGIAPVKVDRELFELIERSLKVSAITAGAFDISGTVSRYYWQFDGKENTRLPQDQINELRDLINFQNIELNPKEGSVFLRKKGMKIGFGGIGKGYAALRAKQVMQAMGIQSGLVNASGDLMCWGKPPNKKSWTINIPDPKNRMKSLIEFSIPNGSIVTSGNYENYTLIDGKRYSHIVDPRTGCPVEFIKNVTVVCPNPELADAMATAITVMGIEQGIKMIDRLNGIECMMIDKNDEVYFSKGLNQ